MISSQRAILFRKFLISINLCYSNILNKARIHTIPKPGQDMKLLPISAIKLSCSIFSEVSKMLLFILIFFKEDLIWISVLDDACISEVEEGQVYGWCSPSHSGLMRRKDVWYEAASGPIYEASNITHPRVAAQYYKGCMCAVLPFLSRSKVAYARYCWLVCFLTTQGQTAYCGCN